MRKELLSSNEQLIYFLVHYFLDCLGNDGELLVLTSVNLEKKGKMSAKFFGIHLRECRESPTRTAGRGQKTPRRMTPVVLQLQSTERLTTERTLTRNSTPITDWKGCLKRRGPVANAPRKAIYFFRSILKILIRTQHVKRFGVVICN